MIFKKTFQNASFYRSSLLAWTILIAYEVLFSYFVAGKFQPPIDYIQAYILNITLFYVNSHFILPKYYKKPIYIIAGLIGLEFIGYTVAKFGVSEIYLYFGANKMTRAEMAHLTLMQSIWRFTYFIGLSTGYWFALNIIIQRKAISDLEKQQLLDSLHKQQLEKQLIDSEVAYLKSQINPHFLFNTLNFLYNSAVKTTPKLGDPILLLSDIMRYALTETPQTGKVELADEIEQINTFITLNQYRYDHNLQLSFIVSGNPGTFKILPLILLTPVENIFKYADLKSEEHPAIINLEITENRLKFRISNKKLKRRRSIVSHGVGIKNLKLRLDVYYQDAYDIQITDNEEDYTFELQLTL